MLRAKLSPQLSLRLRIAGSGQFRTVKTGLPVREPAVAATSTARPGPRARITSTSPPTPLTWSSPQDRIARNAFSSDYVSAWALFDACLENKNLERAESVLLGLTEISPENDEIALAVNNYLLRLVEVNAGNSRVATDWLKKIEYSVPRFRSNEVTEAIMVKNAYLSGSQPALASYLQQRFGNDNKKLVRVLKRVEVLGLDALRAIVDAAGLSWSKLDTHTWNYLRHHQALEEAEAEKRSGESESKPEDAMPAPIPKIGYATLEPTESAGLRSIRHALTGLTISGKKAELSLSALPLVQDKDINKNNYIDFFEISKQLKTPEEKAKFEEIMNNINEYRQRALETRGVEAARMKWQSIFEKLAEADSSQETKINLRGLETLLWQWNQAMLPLVRDEIERLKEISKYRSVSEIPDEIKSKFRSERGTAASAGSLSDKFEYGPYLTLVNPENLPAMTMMELVRLNSTRAGADGVRSVKAVLNVGKNVELDYQLGISKQATTRSKNGDKFGSRLSARHRIRTRISTGEIQPWPTTVRAKIGSLLISLLLKVARVPVVGTDPVTGDRVTGRAPAFHHTYQYIGGNKVGVLRPHKVVAKYLSGESTAAIVSPQLLPMLCEPRPWTAWNEGGYYYTPCKIIRTRSAPEQLAYVAAASEREQLGRVYDGLNVLGRTPWTINKKMFRVISEIWNSKKEFLDIPPHVAPHADISHLKVPERGADPEVRRDYLREMRRLTLENGRLYSQRCDLNYKLDVARAFLGERFYMPHNLDFRGRAYPLSPHLNHLGNDVSRSLLMFWNGRKLGPTGLRWLKIHVANLFGVNKASHADRVAFVDSHMQQIRDSASNPLNGEGWWKTGESPFQLLSACMELTSALDNPDGPEEYVSHLTVHQDGSCNGLQHYAALGGDVEGACQVNLAAADRPQDVYSKVLEIVVENVKKDAESDKDLKCQAIAKLAVPHLSRKVVKQTVMTHVYGVTFIGARDQIANRLKDLDSFPAEEVHKTATYLASKVLGAVRQLFESAHEIQDWLGENATRITRSIVVGTPGEGESHSDKKFMSSVIWTTPLGLPIVQPYREEKRRQIQTELQTVYIEDPYAFQSVNPRKQRMAFPPNYIHSLDASHMLMSALACSNDNIDFASVHDSYWTHAGSVDIMNKNLRERFVELHSEDLIAKLRLEFQQRYSTHLQLVEIPIDSEAGEHIINLRKEAREAKTCRGLPMLAVSEQIEMEFKADPTKETPLRYIEGLPNGELYRLVTDAQQLKRSAAYDASFMRSTEHEGTGLDRVDSIDDANEESEKPAKRGRRVVSVLAPLTIPEVPKKGSFDVKQVLDSPYFFS